MYKERRLWYFTCKCGRKAQSHKKVNAKNERCAVCRRNMPNENQASLFGLEVKFDKDQPLGTIKILPKNNENG